MAGLIELFELRLVTLVLFCFSMQLMVHTVSYGFSRTYGVLRYVVG